MKYNIEDYIFLKENLNNELFNNVIGLIINIDSLEKKYVVKLFNDELFERDGYIIWRGRRFNSNRWYVYDDDIQKKIDKGLINFI